MAGRFNTVACAATVGAMLCGTLGEAARAEDHSRMAHPGEVAESGRTAVAAGVYTSEDGGTVTYEARYFEPYQVVTAADMLRWVPGGAELVPSGPGNQNQDDKRGFGSGGDQVLINGKRISGKSNDIGSAMQRIQADVVSRIEVIRGTTAGLDVRSEGTLINIVLSDEVRGGSGSWQLHSAFYGKDEPDYDGLVSWNSTVGRMNYQVSAQYGPYNRGNQIDRYDDYYAPGSGALLEHRVSDVPQLNSEAVLGGSASWAFANGDLLNLNARLADHGKTEDDTTLAWIGDNTEPDVLLDFLDEDGVQWETGGDFERRIGPGTWKTRVIYTHDTTEEAERVALSSTVPGNVPAQSQVDTDDVATEAIVRSSYGMPLTPAQNLEFGLEGAQNTLSIDVQLFEVASDGGLTPVDLYNSNSEVTEDRYEFFSTHFWRPGRKLVLESALNVEYSRIGQAGLDVENARSFTYIKPRFDARYDLTDVTQLRGSLERTVSQLAFDDFVAGFDNDNDQVDAGNPELEPEKAWELKLAWERRLANDNGVLQAEFFYSDIEDHIDNIRVTDTLSAAGNIGDATNYGLELKGSLRLATIGIDGAVLDATYVVQDSETTDPFTGATRRMSDKRAQEYKLNFRHDIAAWRFNYNVQLDWSGEVDANDVNYRETSTSVGPRTHLAMQYRLTDNLLLWFDTRLLLGGKTRRTRDRYIGNVADNNLLRHEVRDWYFRREYILGVRGQF